MQTGIPSRTAWGAAAHRAAHQVLEQGRIFADPLALRILGEDAAEAVRRGEEQMSRRMRLFIAVRTRFAEDCLVSAIRQGTRQIVVLGAGLDTYAYRTTLPEHVRMYEVDHPATQAWKRDCLDRAGIGVPDFLTYAPVDFEKQTLSEGLSAAGFNPRQAAFFTWLGVVPYLTKEAVWSTLRYIASIEGSSHVVFDYSDPPAALSEDARAFHDLRAARVAELGEPWKTYFEAEELRRELNGIGFNDIDDLGPREILARYFAGAAIPVPDKGGHVVRASTAPL